MRLKAALQNKVAKTLFSPARRDAKRRKAEKARRAKGLPHEVEYFHDASDPYSHLMAQLLPDFARRYDVDLRVHITPPPPDWAAPDRARLDAYARKDADRLAKKMGLAYSDPGQQPTPSDVGVAQTQLLAAIEAGVFHEKAADIGERLWRRELETDGSDPIDDAVLAAAANRRDTLGHYLGGTVFYAGEWYWGPDRLHFLETRLQALGAGDARTPLFAPPTIETSQPVEPKASAPELHWYLSFRSPYTGIVRDRVKQLADAYGAELKIRYVLPMVMRGMQVPRKKGFYIMRDTVREAERLGVAFGNSVDPVGEPVERGYAILHEAIRRGRGYAFAQSFLAGVWADGLDAGTDKGLKTMAERAGLPWSEMKPLLGTDDWRDEAEANQEEMFKYGLWGVPSFRVGEIATWGQDRLWLIEDALKTARAA